MILIIEQDSAMRQALELYLESLGFAAFSAKDALAAVRLHGHELTRFQVVILDADQNPHIGRVMRDFHSIHEGLRFIITHGFGPEGGMVSGLTMENLRLIRKPYEPREIQEALKDLMV